MSLSLVVEDDDDAADTMTVEEQVEFDLKKKKGSLKDVRVSILSLSENKGILGLLKEENIEVRFNLRVW